MASLLKKINVMVAAIARRFFIDLNLANFLKSSKIRIQIAGDKKKVNILEMM
jgi:hypothetical protein